MVPDPCFLSPPMPSPLYNVWKLEYWLPLAESRSVAGLRQLLCGFWARHCRLHKDAGRFSPTDVHCAPDSAPLHRAVCMRFCTKAIFSKLFLLCAEKTNTTKGKCDLYQKRPKAQIRGSLKYAVSSAS